MGGENKESNSNRRFSETALDSFVCSFATHEAVWLRKQVLYQCWEYGRSQIHINKSCMFGFHEEGLMVVMGTLLGTSNTETLIFKYPLPSHPTPFVKVLVTSINRLISATLQKWPHEITFTLEEKGFCFLVTLPNVQQRPKKETCLLKNWGM